MLSETLRNGVFASKNRTVPAPNLKNFAPAAPSCYVICICTQQCFNYCLLSSSERFQLSTTVQYSSDILCAVVQRRRRDFFQVWKRNTLISGVKVFLNRGWKGKSRRRREKFWGPRQWSLDSYQLNPPLVDENLATRGGLNSSRPEAEKKFGFSTGRPSRFALIFCGPSGVHQQYFSNWYDAV